MGKDQVRFRILPRAIIYRQSMRLYPQNVSFGNNSVGYNYRNFGVFLLIDWTLDEHIMLYLILYYLALVKPSVKDH